MAPSVRCLRVNTPSLPPATALSYHTIPLQLYLLHLYLYCTCSSTELVLRWLPLIIDSTLGYWMSALLTLPNAPHPLNVVDHHHPTIVINVLKIVGKDNSNFRSNQNFRTFFYQQNGFYYPDSFQPYLGNQSEFGLIFFKF